MFRRRRDKDAVPEGERISHHLVVDDRLFGIEFVVLRTQAGASVIEMHTDKSLRDGGMLESAMHHYLDLGADAIDVAYGARETPLHPHTLDLQFSPPLPGQASAEEGGGGGD